MKPLIVGIAGGTASGKTTVARGAVAALGDRATLIEHDRYYRTVDPAIVAHPDRVRLHNYDHPDALETDLLLEDLRKLRAGQSVRIPAYDYATSSRFPEHRWALIEPRPVLVVEGILIFAHAELSALFDARFYVDAPDDLRLARRLRRDIAERGQSVVEVLDQYLEMVRPMHERFVAPHRGGADTTVLDGTSAADDLVRQVLARVNTLAGGAS